MTEILYMKDAESNYVREFDASIIAKGENYVVLDRTAFYAEGGGQPSDVGTLQWQGGQSKVSKVIKEKGVVKHIVDVLPPVEKIHGIIDWERRYAHMRMHTSQHLISGIVWKLYQARTVGNQIHAQYSHIDFRPAKFSAEDLERIQLKCNKIVSMAIPLDIYEEERPTLERQMDQGRAIMNLLPQSIMKLRVVKIGEFDICPCGGTHLRNTSEIGRINILERRSKGKDVDRIIYELISFG